MQIRDQRTPITFIDIKKIDLIINSKFIRSQETHHKKLHHMDLQETIVLKIKERERESHLATAYGPEGLQ
jgi:hypothetical protein